MRSKDSDEVEELYSEPPGEDGGIVQEKSREAEEETSVEDEEVRLERSRESEEVGLEKSVEDREVTLERSKEIEELSPD